MRRATLLVCLPIFLISCSSEPTWQVDFFDDFETFDEANWQDQILWVNNEDQCYLRDGEHGTREVSDGTLKLRVVDLGEPVECDNMSKFGEQHPPTQFVAGRIASKNRKEFVKGRWTARLRVPGTGQPGMFPAWWLLGARNNEPPVQEADEDICWPSVGSGEIDIFEHHGANPEDKYVARAIKETEPCNGDWWTYQRDLEADIDEFQEYGVEFGETDLIYLLNGQEVARNDSLASTYPEPLFAILNFAKIEAGPMEGPWVMEVDWVRHESLK
ncbi:MAG: family 16 glycosylhydrolase [Rhodothermales bacterium]|nr:family 16 glycosylhydrolase [Rhodothermales bacterium]MBO6779425.1 family 16 glycosylhydrolase [Rhodothermales bacterium]